MAIFSNKIEQVKFVDREEKTIEILYSQDSEVLSTFYLEINYEDQNFLDLLEEISIEEIQDRTRDYYQSIENNKNLIIHQAAKSMFDEWITNAQADLDKQDEERYKIFDLYKEESYKEVDAYKEEQLKVLKAEIDLQIEERYKEADAYKEEQLKILHDELDLQIEERYKEVETYKKEQLKILQTEIDEQLERRVAEGFKDVDAYRDKQLNILQAELDLQVQNRYKEADAYRSEQLQILQKEIDEQVQGRYKEVDTYKEEQLKILEAQQKKEVEETKSLLLEKFQAVTAPSLAYTPEKAIKNIIDNFEDEDTVFKAKLEIFNLPEVKNSKNREIKMKVRKAKTVPEIFAAYYDIQHSNS